MFRVRRAVGTAVVMLLSLTLSGCGKKAEAPSSTSTTTTQQVKVTRVDLGRGVGADKKVTDATTNFKPNDTIYASVQTSGAAPSATVGTRWTYQDGQVVDESQRTIAPQGDEVTEFHIAKPNGWPIGKYKLEIILDGTSVESKEFEVKA